MVQEKLDSTGLSVNDELILKLLPRLAITSLEWETVKDIKDIKDPDGEFLKRLKTHIRGLKKDATTLDDQVSAATAALPRAFDTHDTSSQAYRGESQDQSPETQTGNQGQ